MGEIRIGRVSGINYEKGSVNVIYENEDNTVVTDIPFLCNKEYYMPKIGEMIVVLEISNGTEIAIGTFFNNQNRPSSAGKLYKKEIGEKSFFMCEQEEVRIKAKKIILETDKAEVIF